MTQAGQRSRFDSPSRGLNPNALVSRRRKLLYVCLLVAAAVHLSLGWVRASSPGAKAPKPLTTQFVKRQPRLTKPLELKKRPQPKPRRIQRRMVAVQARASRATDVPGVRPMRALKGLAQPSAALQRSAGFQHKVLEPQAIAQVIVGARESKHQVDMSLDMLDLEALDTGRYRAMVVQDPDDKRNIKGFVHVALGCSTSESNDVQDPEFWQEFKGRRNYGVIRLAEAMNRYTMIRTRVAGWLPFTSDELFVCPWVFVTSYRSFSVTDTEALNLGKYLLGGGFVFADFLGTRSGSPRGNHYLRMMLKGALASQGLRLGLGWQLDVLPYEHAIFHCFFGFNDGPPIAQEANKGWAYWWGPTRLRPLEGVYVDRRMVALTGEKGYWTAWSDWGHARTGYGHLDPTRPLQFGVNLIVFALTQEGSITHRLMQSVR